MLEILCLLSDLQVICKVLCDTCTTQKPLPCITQSAIFTLAYGEGPMFVFGLNSPFVKVFERLSFELVLRSLLPGSVVF